MMMQTRVLVLFFSTLALAGCNGGDSRLSIPEAPSLVDTPQVALPEPAPAPEPAPEPEPEPTPEPLPTTIVPASDSEFSATTDTVTGMAVAYADFRNAFVETRRAFTYWLKSRTFGGVRDARASQGQTTNPMTGDSHSVNLVASTADLDLDTLYGFEFDGTFYPGTGNIDMDRKVLFSGIKTFPVRYLSDGKTADVDLFFCVGDITYTQTVPHGEAFLLSEESNVLHDLTMSLTSNGGSMTTLNARGIVSPESAFWVRRCDDVAFAGEPTGAVATVPDFTGDPDDNVPVVGIHQATAGEIVEWVPRADGRLYSSDLDSFVIRNGVFLEYYPATMPSKAFRLTNPDYVPLALVIAEPGERITQVGWMGDDLIFTVASTTDPRIEVVFSEQIDNSIAAGTPTGVVPVTVHRFASNPFSNLPLSSSPVEIQGLEVDGETLVMTHSRNGQAVSGALRLTFGGTNPINFRPGGATDGTVMSISGNSLTTIEGSSDCVGFLDKSGDDFACESFATNGSTLIF